MRAEWADSISDVYARFHIDKLADDLARRELTERMLSMHNMKVPSPIFSGAFTTEVDENTQQPIGAFCSVACEMNWTVLDRTLIEQNRLALRLREYTWDEILQILEADKARPSSASGILFYAWQPQQVNFAPHFSRVSMSTFTSKCKSSRSGVSCASGHATALGGGCDYPSQFLFKTVSSGLEQ